MASTIRMMCMLLDPMMVINLAVDPLLSRGSTTEYLRGPPNAEAEFILGDGLRLLTLRF